MAAANLHRLRKPGARGGNATPRGRSIHKFLPVMTSRTRPILIVDDDPDAVALTKHALAKAGIKTQIDVMENGDQAIAYLKQKLVEGDHARGASRKRDEADVMWALRCPIPFDRDTVGRLVLGRWQRVFLVELDGPRERQISALLLAEAGQ